MECDEGTRDISVRGQQEILLSETRPTENVRREQPKMKQIISACNKEIRITGRLLRIGRAEGDGYESIEAPETMVEGLRTCGVRIDLFTFLQLQPETLPKYDYPMELDNAAVVPVSTFDQWWNQQIRPEARNRARQAEKKGVVLREVPFDDVLAKGIWEIYNESPFRQGRRFPHYGKDLKTVYAESATFLDSSFFIGAFFRDKLIGFVKLTTDQSKTRANLMNILSAIEHRDKAPTNALIAHSVRSCADRGIQQLVYQRFAYGNKEADGIMKFKQVNGFKRVDLPRYYVPITTLGSVAFRMGLHHPLIDRIPKSAAGKLRELRNSWYSRRFQTVKEST
ncbi:MAG: hypothetical protein JWQ87_4628 [Candidatus Sulfotelmatobacter sp.]|nr:hypothetical protein [Candidatus Sulfotelmatobacter sp.]